MSKQETKSGSKAGGSEVVVVDQAPPYRPPEPEESSPQRRQRLRAPAGSSVTGKKKKESSHTSTARKMSKSSKTPLTEHEIGKITSATAKKSESQNETIAMTSLEPASTKQPDTASLTSRSTKPAAPIPPDVSSKTSVPSSPLPAKPVDEASIGDVTVESDDVSELRTVMDTETKHSEWSDEEEAGGLPRSDSRASRVSRAVRQFFCCGMPYEAPSEDNISARGFAL